MNEKLLEDCERKLKDLAQQCLKNGRAIVRLEATIPKLKAELKEAKESRRHWKKCATVLQKDRNKLKEKLDKLTN